MSVVEKTLRKVQESKRLAAETPTPGVGGQGVSPASSAAVERSPAIVLDTAALRAAGLIAPADEERRLSYQYRKVKRPLIANAIGRGTPRLPMGYLIMLASALPGEGKSFTAVNLALSIAKEKDLSVLLVDGDVAKPQLTRVLGLEGERGLLDVLRDSELDVESVIRPTDVPKLSFLPAGVSSAEATELLVSKRMEQVAALLGQRDSNRIVLFDTSPLMQTTESPALAQVAGQIVVVVRAESTPQPVLLDALSLLEEHPSVSLILNQSLHMATSEYYYYGYGNKSDGGPEKA
jgi:protein-tyrosine kinase